MARPKKQGLDYFTNDVNFYQDIKIRKLIRHKGIQAVSVYHILLCQIYASGYYLQWDEDLPFIVSETAGLEEDTIQSIIDYCITIGLFDKAVFEQYRVLTSHGIQERYLAVCATAKRKLSDNVPYLFVNLPDHPVNSKKTIVSSEETGVNSEETPINSEETPINSAKSTQSKVKERKDNNSLRSSLSPSTPPPPARVREAGAGEGAGEDVSEAFDPDAPVTASQGASILRSDRDWLLQMQRKFKLESGRIVSWLESFVVDCDCRGKQQHESLADVKQHFNDWMLKMQSQKSGGRGEKGVASRGMTPEKLWISCQAELCKSVSEDVSRQSFDLLGFQHYAPETQTLTIRVPSKETYENIESNLVSVLAKVCRKYFGQNVIFKYYVPKFNSQNDDKETV